MVPAVQRSLDDDNVTKSVVMNVGPCACGEATMSASLIYTSSDLDAPMR